MAVSSPRALVWHRTDFRLHDNGAVRAAAEAADGAVVGVVVLPADPRAVPRDCRTGSGAVKASRRRADRVRAFATPPGVGRCSPRRLGHTLQALEGLRDDWDAAGSALFVMQGEPGACVSALAEALGVRAVHTAPCLAFDECVENAEVARALEGVDVSLVVHDETTLIAPDDLPFSIDDLPDVFSTYRRQVERSCRVP